MKAAGRTGQEIAKLTDYNPGYISKLAAKYRKGGIEAITENHYGGNHRNMTYEEEAELLKQYIHAADGGHITDVSDIKTAYDEKIGHETGHGQIYNVLHRHGWGIKELDREAESSGKVSDWLERVAFRIRYQLNPRYPDRIQVCLSEEDVTDIETTIKKLLEIDGLAIEFQRKEYQKYRLERVFVERSEGERVAASIFNTLLPSNRHGLKEDKGSYQNRRKPDGFRYGLSITISW